MDWGAYAESSVCLSSPLPSRHGSTPVGTDRRRAPGGLPHLKCHPPSTPHRMHKDHLCLQKVGQGEVLPTPSYTHSLVSTWKVRIRGIIKGNSKRKELVTSYHSGLNEAVWRVGCATI